MLSFEQAKSDLDAVIKELGLPEPRPGEVYLVGGAVRRALMNDLANCPDFDYVVHQDGMLQFHAKGLKARGRTTTADSFETFEGAKVQELHRRRMEGVAQIEVVAQAFDFTMCQVWYDGKAVRCLHPEVLDDIENKLLVVTPIADCVKALTEGRALRFVAEGWTLAPEQAAAVLNVQSRSGSASQRGSQ